MSKKFWEIKNLVNGEKEILMYGPIAGENGLFEDYVTPQGFVADLDSLGGADVTVRINSGGGDVFAAHAIHNTLCAYKGKVKVVIDGLCASAATIVAMAGDTVIMPRNALFMIHNPMLGLNDHYAADELVKAVNALNKCKDSIINAYLKRCKVSVRELEQMMDAETWLNADECLEKGFIDEIEGEVTPLLDNGYVIFNSISCDTSKYKNFASVAKNYQKKEVSNLTKLEEILNKLGLFDEAKPASMEDAVQAERKRILDLDAVAVDANEAVKAIVNVAKADGRSVADVQSFIDAVKNIKPANADAQKHFEDMLKDKQASGVDAIEATPTMNKADQSKEMEEACINYLADVMNKGGK